MPDTYKSYFQRNLKKVIAKLGDIALLDEIAEANLSSELASKINGKAAQADLNTLSGKVTTLIGADTDKAVRAIAAEEVAKIVAGADESFDTLKEIAEWIDTHAASASAMSADIVALKAKAVLGTYKDGEDIKEYATVKAYVEAVEAALEAKIAATLQKTDFSAETTGGGNVVTSVSYDAATGKTTATKGATAILDTDLVDLTDAEVDALFAKT